MCIRDRATTARRLTHEGRSWVGNEPVRPIRGRTCGSTPTRSSSASRPSHPHPPVQRVVRRRHHHQQVSHLHHPIRQTSHLLTRCQDRPLQRQHRPHPPLRPPPKRRGAPHHPRPPSRGARPTISSHACFPTPGSEWPHRDEIPTIIQERHGSPATSELRNAILI